MENSQKAQNFRNQFCNDPPREAIIQIVNRTEFTWYLMVTF